MKPTRWVSQQHFYQEQKLVKIHFSWIDSKLSQVIDKLCLVVLNYLSEDESFGP
jgi:hypothetical protein